MCSPESHCEILRGSVFFWPSSEGWAAMSREKVSTRAAVYYGDRFRDACLILGVNGALLRDAKVISTGTTTKLRRRYKGEPVEREKRDDIIRFFIQRTDDAVRRRLAEKEIDLERDVLLPANWRLTKEAGDLARELPPHTRDAVMKWDHIDDQQIRQMLRGGHAVHKHVYSIARHLFSAGMHLGHDMRGSTSADDLLDQSDDDNKCHPVYRRRREAKRARSRVLGAPAAVAVAV